MIHIKQKAFTLIEMIVVLGIFAVVSSIVLFNYSKFRSTTVLINTAYEVALSIREAQIYGVSVRSPHGSPTPGFTDAYGIYVPTDNTNKYILFADKDTNLLFDKLNCAQGTSECVTPYTLQGNTKFGVVCINKSSTYTKLSSGSSLNIMFKRPNPEPIINNDSAISRAQITVTSDGVSRYIVVANNGQVSVLSQSISPLCN